MTSARGASTLPQIPAHKTVRMGSALASVLHFWPGWGLSHARLGEPLGGKRGNDRDGETNRDARNQQTSEKMLSLASQQMNANGRFPFPHQTSWDAENRHFNQSWGSGKIGLRVWRGRVVVCTRALAPVGIQPTECTRTCQKQANCARWGGGWGGNDSIPNSSLRSGRR